MKNCINLAIGENNLLVRKGIIEIIKSSGNFVVSIEASNGRELYDNLLHQQLIPDIAVFDIAMPDWDGYKTLDMLRHKWPDLKTLILSSYKHDYALMRILEGGANGYLQKNTSPEELQHALHAIYQTGLYFSAAQAKLYQRLHSTTGTSSLTEREIQLLRLAHTDLTYKEIANLMHTTERSVAGYRIRLFEKLGVNSRAALVMCGVQMGLIPIS